MFQTVLAVPTFPVGRQGPSPEPTEKARPLSMNFKRYLLRRLVLAVVVMFGLSIVIFAISRIMPGDGQPASWARR